MSDTHAEAIERDRAYTLRYVKKALACLELGQTKKARKALLYAGRALIIMREQTREMGAFVDEPAEEGPTQ